MERKIFTLSEILEILNSQNRRIFSYPVEKGIIVPSIRDTRGKKGTVGLFSFKDLILFGIYKKMVDIGIGTSEAQRILILPELLDYVNKRAKSPTKDELVVFNGIFSEKGKFSLEEQIVLKISIEGINCLTKNSIDSVKDGILKGMFTSFYWIDINNIVEGIEEKLKKNEE